MRAIIPIKKCKYCKNEIPIPESRHGRCYYKNRKYCSKSCANHINSKINGKIGGRVRAENMKKQKSGFYNPKIQSMGGKAVSKKYGGFAFTTKESRLEASKNSIRTHKKNKTGFFNPEQQRISHIKINKLNKENGTGLWNINVRKSGNSLGGLNAQNTLRFNVRNLRYKNKHFDSIPEIGISICLKEQFNYIPLEGISLHKKVGRYEYDFFLDKLKLFLEYHPFDLKFTDEEYYNRRLDNLIQNGYKDYNLIVIK